MKTNAMEWRRGVKDGIPIALGYIAVSFTFGIIARQMGLNPFQAVFMSATNFTSAGQFAGLTLIVASASFIEMAITQLIINSRYFLMSASLSQKLDKKTPFTHRAIMAFGISDEVFGVSMANKGKLNVYYTFGLITMALPGWAMGTFLGVVSGSLLPPRLISALSIALYAMLIAVIIPPAKGDKKLTSIIFISMLASLLFAVLPVLNSVSSAIKIIVLTVIIAGTAAFLFPVKEAVTETEEVQQSG